MTDVPPPPGGQPPYNGGMTPPPPGGGYNAPPPPGGFPGSGQAPNNNLVLAILTTVLCCLPLGIWAIVKAAEVNGKWSQGDYAGAQASADTAKKVSLWGIGVGLVVTLGYAALMLGGVFSLSTY